MKKNPMNIIWMLLGFLCLAFGTIGIVLPILPTVPRHPEWASPTTRFTGSAKNSGTQSA